MPEIVTPARMATHTATSARAPRLRPDAKMAAAATKPSGIQRQLGRLLAHSSLEMPTKPAIATPRVASHRTTPRMRQRMRVRSLLGSGHLQHHSFCAVVRLRKHVCYPRTALGSLSHATDESGAPSSFRSHLVPRSRALLLPSLRHLVGRASRRLGKRLGGVRRISRPRLSCTSGSRPHCSLVLAKRRENPLAHC